jgi:hypothetical protein
MERLEEVEALVSLRANRSFDTDTHRQGATRRAGQLQR